MELSVDTLVMESVMITHSSSPYSHVLKVKRCIQMITKQEVDLHERLEHPCTNITIKDLTHGSPIEYRLVMAP